MMRERGVILSGKREKAIRGESARDRLDEILARVGNCKKNRISQCVKCKRGKHE